MPEFRFNPEISMGHAVQILTLIIGLIAGYYQIKSDVAAARSEMSVAQVSLEGRLEVNEVRLTSLTNSIDDKLRFIAEQIAELKTEKKH